MEAADGLQAGQAFGDSSVALILLDLKMPGQDGMDLLREHQDQLEECRSSSSRPWAVAPPPSKR